VREGCCAAASTAPGTRHGAPFAFRKMCSAPNGSDCLPLCLSVLLPGNHCHAEPSCCCCFTTHPTPCCCCNRQCKKCKKCMKEDDEDECEDKCHKCDDEEVGAVLTVDCCSAAVVGNCLKRWSSVPASDAPACVCACSRSSAAANINFVGRVAPACLPVARPVLSLCCAEPLSGGCKTVLLRPV
jgi:hypothetical protein